MPPRRKPPMVFRLAAAFLLVSAIAGLWCRRQPAGPANLTIMRLVARACPTASKPVVRPSVTDGARAIDRWAYRRLANLIRRDNRDRCQH